MKRKKKNTTVSVALFFTFGTIFTAVNAQEKFPGPFSPEMDSYAQTVRSTFENLPVIKDKKQIQSKVLGTENIFKANIENDLSKGVRKDVFTLYASIQFIGNININVYGPIDINKKPSHLWVASGRVTYFEMYLGKNKGKKEASFFYVSHFDGKNWGKDCFIFNNVVNTLNSSILNTVSLVSEPIRLEKIKIMHDQAVAKSEWNFSRRTVKGKITGYKNGIVNIQDGNRRPFSLDVTKFSLDDQFLIRAYIDHKGIPIRDEAGGK